MPKISTKNISDMYDDYYIPKRRNKYRHIQAPHKDLKAEQYRLLNVLKTYNLPIHEKAYGFVDGKNIIDNAMSHVNKPFLLNIDLKDFFDTFTQEQVFNFLKNKKVKNSLYISKIVTRNGHVVQGAPTSPYLTNILFFKHDKFLNNLCEKNNITYSRYADDMTFSGDIKNILNVKQSIFDYITNMGFKISWEKVEYRHRCQRQKVTGIVVNKRPNIDRNKANRIRALCHNILRDAMNGNIRNINDIEERYNTKYDELYGYVNFMTMANEKFFKYKEQLDQTRDILRNVGVN